MTADATLETSVAESLETDRALLPYMPELLEDLWALGADPEMVVRLLKPLLPTNAHVLDLACGKGAVSVALASRLGCRVFGLDAMSAFVETARAMAATHDVAHLCHFAVGDIRAYDPGFEQYDAVLLGATGPILGSLRDTVGQLRRMVKPGGYIVLDDAWRVDTEAPLSAPASDYPQRDEALKALTAFGDAIIVEEQLALEHLREENARNNAFIQKRVDTLVERCPSRAALFCAYASRQLHECYLLEAVYRCVVWILQTRAAMTR